MVDPAIALSAPVQFFRLTVQLQPDLDHVEQQLRHSPWPVRAVLMPHYFGLAQDLKPLAALCLQYGAALIEDCAHALPLAENESGMGRTGRWCIASPYKFFPCTDGGVLWSGTDLAWPPLPKLRRPALRSELQQLLNMRSLSLRRAPDGTHDLPAMSEPCQAECESVAIETRLQGTSGDYRAADESLGCTTVSRWLMTRTDISAMLAQRRSNYLTWAAAFEDTGCVRALQPTLGRHDTPYMFPLLIDAPTTQFARLKRAGVPVNRWDCLATSQCQNSAYFRLHLLQLPCHQALRPRDLEWMVSTVQRLFLPSARAAR